MRDTDVDSIMMEYALCACVYLSAGYVKYRCPLYHRAICFQCSHAGVCLFSILFASPLAFQIRFNLMLFIQ